MSNISKIIGFLFLSISILAWKDNQESLIKIQKAYVDAHILSFDGHIQYYESPNNTAPNEVMSVKYRRDGVKVHIEIGNQITIYDGKTNVVVDEDKNTIFISQKKVKGGKSILPLDELGSFIEDGTFDVKEEDYISSTNKQKKVIITSPKTSASSVELLYDPTTHFIQFARMITQAPDMLLDEKLNNKKFEYSYYRYQTKLAEKISIDNYVQKGKKNQFVGKGKYKDYEIINL
jgi:hypothetical protein